jgi:thioredoxin 1
MELELNDKNFDEMVMKSEKPVLVDFWAPWCGPCQMMGPIIENVAREIGDVAAVGKLNVDENPGVAGKYGIMSIPTLIIFKKGAVLKELVGVQAKETLISELQSAAK